MLKPMDSLIFYVGGVAGPEQSDFVPPPVGPGALPSALPMGTMPGPVPGADSHWRELVDLVIDYNPTSAVSFALNGDFDTESNFLGNGSPSESWYGVNLAAKFVVADPFAIALRGEYFGDNKGNVISGATSGARSTSNRER